jgi:protein phosphatase
VVAALFHHDRAVVAHAGDSRLYRWRAGELTLLTRDHSVMQEQIDAGILSSAQARSSPNRNLITRALGVEENMGVEIHEHLTQPGDIYLLCSDGLSDMIAHEGIASWLRRCGNDIDAACDALVLQANENGGRDNISIVLASIQAVRPAPREGLLDRVLAWLR